MFLFGFLLVPLVLAVETNRDGYVINIDDNNVLISVEPVGESSGKIDLSGLSLRGVAEDAFANLRNLSSIDLSNNMIRGINQLTFSKMSNLEHLSLAKNCIMNFHKGTFADLLNLKSLNISKDHLYTDFNKGVFQGLNKPCEIVIEGVLVSSITPNAFHVDLPEDHARNRWPDITRPGSVDHRDPLNANVRVKMCSQNGVATRLDVILDEEVLPSDCFEVSINHEERILMLDSLDITGFARGWYRVQDVPFRGMSLNNNRIARVTPEMLNDLPSGIKFVNLENNEIERLENGVIQNNHLHLLNFEYNKISEIEADTFANTPKLEILFLSSNKLRDTKFVAVLPSTMQWIMLRDNKIEEILAGSLSKFHRLIILDLTENNITQLDSQSLQGLTSLEKLLLNKNSLKTIAPGSFQDLMTLKELDLKWNRLSSITNETLRGLTSNLSSLDVSYNEIQSLATGTFVNSPTGSLDLGSNKISTIEKGAFDLPSLQSLTLRRNRLSRFGKEMVTNLENVNSLDLEDNLITRLENGDLARLGKSVVVRLHSREIEVIQAGLFDEI